MEQTDDSLWKNVTSAIKSYWPNPGYHDPEEEESLLGNETGPYLFNSPKQKNLNGPRLPPRRYLHNGPHATTKQVLADINQTIVIMEGNVEKVLQRGEKVSSLQGKCQDLEISAASFKKTSNNSHNSMWWKQKQLLVMLAILAITILAMIFLIILYLIGVITVK